MEQGEYIQQHKRTCYQRVDKSAFRVYPVFCDIYTITSLFSFHQLMPEDTFPFLRGIFSGVAEC